MTTAADYLVDALTQAGVKRIYGVVGDSLNGISDSLRRSGKIDWIHVRHEEGAAFAAGAEAHLTGHLAVCAGSCGPGNLHLINGLFDCHRSGVPVLAIAAHIPLDHRLFAARVPAAAQDRTRPDAAGLVDAQRARRRAQLWLWLARAFHDRLRANGRRVAQQLANPHAAR